jgi:hypothetical protein
LKDTAVPFKAKVVQALLNFCQATQWRDCKHPLITLKCIPGEVSIKPRDKVDLGSMLLYDILTTLQGL